MTTPNLFLEKPAPTERLDVSLARINGNSDKIDTAVGGKSSTGHGHTDLATNVALLSSQTDFQVAVMSTPGVFL